eukprot:IDg17066t1
MLISTSLVTLEKYYGHRARDVVTDSCDAMFYINYMAAMSVILDDHMLMLHIYTQSSVDMRCTVFTGKLGLPLFLSPSYVSAIQLRQPLSSHIFCNVAFSCDPDYHVYARPLFKLAR